MATEENTYFLRSFLLLIEGGLYISREILGREIQKACGNLDALLKQFEKKLKHEFHGKQNVKLFPQFGTTDINQWDLQLSVGVLINVFGRSLSLTEKQKLRALRDLRNEIYRHCASASLDKKKYEEVQEELGDIITTLAVTFDEPVRVRCSTYVSQFAAGPLDGVKPSLATLDGFSQTCQKKFKVGLHTELTVGGPSDHWINLCERTLNMILNNAESMASEGAGFEEIEENVTRMLDFLQDNQNVVFKGSKQACVILMFECNSYDDALHLLHKLDSQEFNDHLNRISDALLRHYQFDATISISARVRTEFLQSILIAILKSIGEISRSEEVAHRHLEISSENKIDDTNDHAKQMQGSEEEFSQKAESKQPLKLGVECTSKDGLLHILNCFQKDEFSGHLKVVADALSDHFGKNITLKASLDIDDVMAAIEETVSKDSARCMGIQHDSGATDLHENETELDSFAGKQEPTQKPAICSMREELDEDFDTNLIFKPDSSSENRKMMEPMEPRTEQSTEPPIECYAMNNMFRGHAVIIANENFIVWPNCPGAKGDAFKMETLFRSLDFHVTVFTDCNASEMKHIIKQASKSPMNLDADCFVLVLSTHGYEEQVTETPVHMQDATIWRQTVLGVDGLPVYVDDILELFDSKSGESFLNGKPKLFFLQASRSRHFADRGRALESYETDAKIKVSISNIQPSDAELHDDKFADLVISLSSCRISPECVNETDSWLPRRDLPQQNVTVSVETDPPNPVPVRPVRQSTYDIVPLTCPDDCLIMYPVASGKFAFRLKGVGSYMLHYMYQEINRTLLLQGRDILQYLTSVNNSMASTEIYYEPTGLNVDDPVEMEYLKQNMPLKMTPSIVHRLTKSLMFKPKPQNSVMENLMNELRIN